MTIYKRNQIRLQIIAALWTHHTNWESYPYTLLYTYKAFFLTKKMNRSIKKSIGEVGEARVDRSEVTRSPEDGRVCLAR